HLPPHTPIVLLEQRFPPVIGRPEIQPGDIVQEVSILRIHPIQNGRYPPIFRQNVAKPITPMSCHSEYTTSKVVAGSACRGGPRTAPTQGHDDPTRLC